MTLNVYLSRRIEPSHFLSLVASITLPTGGCGWCELSSGGKRNAQSNSSGSDESGDLSRVGDDCQVSPFLVPVTSIGTSIEGIGHTMCISETPSATTHGK